MYEEAIIRILILTLTLVALGVLSWTAWKLRKLRKKVVRVVGNQHSRMGRMAKTQVPYGEPLTTFIQWKGTDLCMDWFCEKGHQNHWDGYFAYEMPCEDCKDTYYPATSVVLRKTKE